MMMRAVRQGGRLQRRQGRLDAHRRLLGRHAGRQRRRRGRLADRGGRGACAEAAGGDAITCCFFGDGAINRGPFLEALNWAGLRPAGAVRVRGQPLERHHRQRADDGGRGRLGAIAGTRHPATAGRRQRRGGGAVRPRLSSPKCAPAAARACCTPAPTASRATCRSTPRSTATRPNSRRRCATTRSPGPRESLLPAARSSAAGAGRAGEGRESMRPWLPPMPRRGRSRTPPSPKCRPPEPGTWF
jgi:hypothetical protein